MKHVFHYPADPSKERPHAKLDYENESEEESSSSSSDDSYSSVEDVGSEEEGGGRRNGHSDESTSPEKNSDRPWRPKISNKNNFLGLPTGFEHFLSPPSSYHKKRFEMSIGQLVYLGWPVFSNENGEWKRKKKHRNSKDASKRMSTISEQGVDGMGRRSSVQINEELDKTTGNESVGEEQESTAEDATVQSFENLTILAEEEDVEDEEDTPSKPTRRGLNMFHVVFVMNPPTTEYQRRVDEMYKHVVKKFSRALKWEQVRSNYVQKECEKMKAMKAKHGLSLHEI